MSAESSEPDYTEVIDVTSLPNWNDPQVQGAFAKIDEFLADASKGELPTPQRMDRGEAKNLVDILSPEHVCDDPTCDDGVVNIDVSTYGGMERAVRIVEEAVIRAHLQADAIEDEGESQKVLSALVDHVATLPQEVVMWALMAVAEGAVSLIQEVQRLRGDGNGPVA